MLFRIEFNREIAEETNELLKGVSRMKSLEIILDSLALEVTDEEKQRLCQLKNEWYREMIDKMTQEEILPGIQNLLSWLNELNIKKAIGSSSRNTKLVLDRTNLKNDFDAVADGTDDVKSKPAPDIFLLAAKRMGVLPQESIVIEDAQSGVNAAKEGGFRCIGIGNSITLEGADIQVPSLETPYLEKIKDFISNN
jgi:beta-phosphoglucomutase